MTNRIKKYSILLILLLILSSVVVYRFRGRNSKELINSFDECVEAGNLVMESYPLQCSTPDGKTFTQDIGNEIEKADLIHLISPWPNAEVSSPLVVEGEARGFWFFEASFPVKLYDENNNLLASGIAQAKEDWMTTEFVSFATNGLVFEKPATKKGLLVLEKDNPSGLAENADALKIPVVFK